MPLTDAQIRNTKPQAKSVKLTDGAGLYLEVRSTGTKLWRYRYRIDGKENTFAIGKYPEVGLSDARSQRGDARKLVKKGIHPAHNRKTERLKKSVENANTFEAVALEWIGKRQSGWSDYYHDQVKRGLKANIYKYIGAMPNGLSSPIHSACMLPICRSGIFLRHSFIVVPLLSLNGTLGMSFLCRLLPNSDLLFLICSRNDVCNFGVERGTWYVIQ